MDSISIENLIVFTKIGITDKERDRRQAVIIDLYIYRDLSIAGTTDELVNTSNYSEIRDQVNRYVSKGEFRLLEGIAEGIASLLLENYGAMKVKVRVRKKKYTTTPNIGIEIMRARLG